MHLEQQLAALFDKFAQADPFTMLNTGGFAVFYVTMKRRFLWLFHVTDEHAIYIKDCGKVWRVHVGVGPYLKVWENEVVALDYDKQDGTVSQAVLLSLPLITGRIRQGCIPDLDKADYGETYRPVLEEACRQHVPEVAAD